MTNTASLSTPDPYALANELVADTVCQAMNAPFYADLYHQAGVDITSVKHVHDLSRLPIVEKEALREAGQLSLSTDRRGDVSHIQHTTGTTGEPFVIHRSMSEARFIEAFFSRLNATDRALRGPVPIMLQTQFPDHGMSTTVPARIFVLPFSVTDERLMEYALLMLRREFDLPDVETRVSILSGSHTGILVLTNYVMERGIDARREFQIKLVHLEGRYLTRRWRAVLENTWGGTISDKYSLAEVFGGANYCIRCKGFHFDPFVVPEVVDTMTRERVERGTGALLLTSLFPFVQLQPMIRYWTGDLFEIDPSGCDRPRYVYRGRLNHALFSATEPGNLLLTGVDVIEALDGAPEVNRTIRFRDLVRMQYQQAGGELKLKGLTRQDGRKTEIQLFVELTFQPGLYPEREVALQQHLLEELVSRSANIEQAIASGQATIDIAFARPNTLTSLERFGPLWAKE